MAAIDSGPQPSTIPSDRQAVRDVIQRTYGDATQTALDDQAAGATIDALRRRGWASLEEVAWLIACAGGRIDLDPAKMPSRDAEVLMTDGVSGVRTVMVREPGRPRRGDRDAHRKD